MSDLCKNFAFLTQYICNLRGKSRAILARASDGFLYAVKFAGNLQGPNLLFNESIGSELYRACGLIGPDWKPLLITDAFIQQNQDCRMQTLAERLRPDGSLCFGSRFLEENDSRLFEILPETTFKRIHNRESFWLAWFIDICACHADNRKAIFLEDGEGWLGAHFIDHGHLFGGLRGELRPRVQASRYLDQRIYRGVSSTILAVCETVAQRLDVDKLWRRIEALPDDWKRQSALDTFSQCLCTLSTPRLVQNILDAMVDAEQQANQRENDRSQDQPKLPRSELDFGMQTPRWEYYFGSRGYSAAARAKA